MSLSREEVRRLAELARIEVAESEEESLAKGLGSVLGYVDRLSKVDTAGVPETETDFGPHGLRYDQAIPAEASVRSAIVKLFPERVGDALSVPAVFEKPKG